MKPSLKLFYLAFGLSLLIHKSLLAQSDEYVVRHYTIKDGLSDDAVTYTIQDSKGIVWIGTWEDGLNKFDGVKFTTFQHNPADYNSLSDNRLYSNIVEDDSGKLWIGTYTGLDIFDPKTERFQKLIFDSLLLHKSNSIVARPGIRTIKVRKRKDGKIWICTANGIYLADPLTLEVSKLSSFSSNSQKQDNFSSNLLQSNFKDIAETSDGSVWAFTTKGVIHWDAANDATKLFHLNPFDLISTSPYDWGCIYIDDLDRVWIGSNFGLSLYNKIKNSFDHFLPSTPSGSLRIEDTKFEPNAIVKTHSGKLLIGSRYGLYSFDPTTKKFEILIDHYTWCITKLKNNVLIGTSNGLFSLTNNPPKFRSFNSELEESDLLAVVDRKNYIWSDFMNLASDGKGGVWRLSGKKLYRFKSKDDIISSINLTTAPISIYKDTRGKIWFGGREGIELFNPNIGELVTFPDFPAVRVFSICEEPGKYMWMATEIGLYRLSLNDYTYKAYQNDPNDLHSLPSNVTNSVIIDQNGDKWVASALGLSKLIDDTATAYSKFKTWNSSNSIMTKQFIKEIVEDDTGTIWLIGGDEVYRFFPETEQMRKYGYYDGLYGTRIWNVWKDPSGRIFFEARGGYKYVVPDSLENNSFIPPVILTDMSVQNKKVPIQGNFGDTLSWGTPLTTSITYANEIILPYDQNDFSLEFAALNFLNPENNLYKFKLEPYETDWIETTAENRIARYTNISPGEYTFRVIGSNNDGIWNETGASLDIIIHPPWWMTWWAYVIYGMIVMGMLLTIRAYEMKRMKVRDRAKYLSELDQLKTRFFTNISHEFRTPLTLILGPLKSMYEGTFTGDRKSALAVMIRNGQRLLNLINQLLDISKLEAGKMKMQVINTDLVELLQQIAASYESLAKEKQIRYFFYPDRQELQVDLDQDKTEKIVHNLLSNAFKFTPEGGEVILHLKEEDKWAIIQVKDSGQGIPDADLDKIFDRFYQVDSSQTRTHEGSGLGMALTKELVELHRGAITLESKEGQGTTFTVRLPIEQKHISRGKADNDNVDAREIEAVVSTHGISDPEIEEEIGEENNNLPVLLIVEDNTDMRKYIKSTLQKLFQIREAENGKEGLTMANEMMPDLIISDVMMPEMDGFQLCKQIKTEELTSHIPVILLTAKADRTSKLSGLELGADDYLSKPFHAEELKLIVKNRITERQKMRERFSKDITLEPRHIAISSMDEQFLQKVMEIIEEHISDDQLSIEKLSHEAGYSQVQFYRKIKALSGQTPSQFLRIIRLKRAAELLKRKSNTVSQVAYSVGFSSLAYFSQCFKEQFGVTPGRFTEDRNIMS